MESSAASRRPNRQGPHVGLYGVVGEGRGAIPGRREVHLGLGVPRLAQDSRFESLVGEGRA